MLQGGLFSLGLSEAKKEKKKKKEKNPFTWSKTILPILGAYKFADFLFYLLDRQHCSRKSKKVMDHSTLIRILPC